MAGRFPGIRWFVLCTAMLTVCGGIAWAKTVVVWLSDRVDPLRGELIGETEETVTLSIAGIATTLDRNRVVRIDFELTLEEEYQQRSAEVKSDDFIARYDLARWLYDRGTARGDEMAQRELANLLDADPENERAKLLLGLVDQRVRTREESNNQATSTGPVFVPPVQPPAGSPSSQDQQQPLLTEEQCSLLKIYELNLAQHPRVQITDEVLNEFLDKYRTELSLADYQEREGRARFKQLDGYEQLRIMFDAKARDFYGRVIVRDEPEPLVFFRTKVNPIYIVGYFMRNFGAEPTPGVKLVTDNPQHEAAAYTNFLMLHLARVDGRPFIDREKPDESLLLQWGLPRLSAKYPAPDVPGWKQFFTGIDDDRFTLYVNWVKMLYYPTPTYPIEYPPPPAPQSPAPAAAQ